MTDGAPDDRPAATWYMAVPGPLPADRRWTRLGGLRRSAERLSARLFAPREVILRADGRVSYLRLSAGVQKIAAGTLAAAVAWGVFASASYVAHRDTLATKDRTIASQERAYGELETDFEQALGERDRLAGEIDRLKLSLSREVERSRRLTWQRAALVRRTGSLQRRLADLHAAHQRVVERFRDLAMDRAEAIESTITETGLDADRLVSTVLRSNLGRGGPLIPIRDAVPGPDRNAGLTDALAGLNEQWDRLSALRELRRTLPLTAPLDQYWISSPYGERVDPFTGERSRHSGVDMVAPLGSEIRATAPGRVVFAGKRPRYGRLVEIDHGHGITTRYAHLGKILAKTGQRVQRGQTIGTLGSSGRSTGPHLHYEVRSGSSSQDPTKFLDAGVRAIEG
jgi:murein DD-endopeptidase MepM/ murein hydrolase activator NlpD